MLECRVVSKAGFGAGTTVGNPEVMSERASNGLFDHDSGVRPFRRSYGVVTQPRRIPENLHDHPPRNRATCTIRRFALAAVVGL